MVLDRHLVVLGQLGQLRLNGLGDLVQGGVVHLLDDGHAIDGLAGLGGTAHARRRSARLRGWAAGAKGQGYGRGGGNGKEPLHGVALFHVLFLQKNILSGR